MVKLTEWCRYLWEPDEHRPEILQASHRTTDGLTDLGSFNYIMAIRILVAALGIPKAWGVESGSQNSVVEGRILVSTRSEAFLCSLGDTGCADMDT
jgi:hypothetical protein